jgi:hypothetical protein
MYHKTLTPLTLLAALFVLTGAAQAQYTIDWYTIDGGGMMNATGGAYELSSTAGQPDAGTIFTPGRYMIEGGFWNTGLLPCPADFNGDGSVDFFDYDDFVTCFEGGACPPGRSADFNGDGSVDFFDYDDFVIAFETPC